MLQLFKRFYAIIVVATVVGTGMDFTAIDPMKALYWSAVVNGVVSVPIMAAMMVVASRKSEMGQFVAPPAQLIFGWLATAVMAASTIAMFVLS